MIVTKFSSERIQSGWTKHFSTMCANPPVGACLLRHLQNTPLPELPCEMLTSNKRNIHKVGCVHRYVHFPKHDLGRRRRSATSPSCSYGQGQAANTTYMCQDRRAIKSTPGRIVTFQLSKPHCPHAFSKTLSCSTLYCISNIVMS